MNSGLLEYDHNGNFESTDGLFAKGGPPYSFQNNGFTTDDKKLTLSKQFSGLYSTFHQRELSFESWPEAHDGPKPSDMALAGLYYSGRGDVTVCFKCGTRIKQWAKRDSAIAEHKRWSPNCVYVNYLTAN